MPATIGDATAAGQSTLLNAVNAITTNTARSGPVVSPWFVRPSGGLTAYEITLRLWNLQGVPEDADGQAATIHARLYDGTSMDGHLTSTAMTRVAMGRYKATYAVQASDAAGVVYFDFAWAVGGTAMADGAATQVQDAESLSTLLDIQGKAANIAAAVAQIPTVTPDNAGIAAIKAKTDALPALPAAVGDAMTLTAAYDRAKAAAVPGEILLTPGQPIATDAQGRVTAGNAVGGQSDNITVQITETGVQG